MENPELGSVEWVGRTGDLALMRPSNFTPWLAENLIS